MGTEEKQVLAMYDVRGIQKYIFNTPKVKDAIGASYIVENIIVKALTHALNVYEKETGVMLNSELKWCLNKEVKIYQDNQELDVQVLYIGGGNAYVVYKTKELCVSVNKIMAKHIIETTYSLQLAVGIVPKTNNYQDDYQKLMNEMEAIKANMIVSKPLGTLPIAKDDEHVVSFEQLAKKIAEKEKRNQIEERIKIFDNYVTEKGIDSVIAVVHIDGNNMGLRIREQLKNETEYENAVNKMRTLSFNINQSYKKAFDDMSKKYNQDGKLHVLQILVAGDDITYVCNGKVALETVRYYVNEISKYSMNGKNDEKSLEKYGFSVCAGIAYVGSHFPFSVAYEVAEACCDSAKSEAKKDEFSNGQKVGNWVDYQIVKSVHAKNLEALREKEYLTCTNEQLIRRPYFISTENNQLDVGEKSLEKLIAYVDYFKDNEKIPNSLKKRIRNTYSLGEMQVEILNDFLKSRNHKMPDGESNMYDEIGNCKIAKWYDALEIMDYVVDKEEK